MTEPTRGLGLMVPVAKALSHYMIVYSALRRSWPMTAEQALEELREARAHLLDIDWTLINSISTAEAKNTIKTPVENLIAHITALATPENLEDPASDYLKPAEWKRQITSLWGILSNIDLEVTGLPAESTDAGQLP